jgi:hypothetical protein
VQLFVASHDKKTIIQETAQKQGKLENLKIRGFEGWEYVEQKDLNSTITDAQGRSWKFCTMCLSIYKKNWYVQPVSWQR